MVLPMLALAMPNPKTGDVLGWCDRLVVFDVIYIENGR